MISIQPTNSTTGLSGFIKCLYTMQLLYALNKNGNVRQHITVDGQHYSQGKPTSVPIRLPSKNSWFLKYTCYVQESNSYI